MTDRQIRSAISAGARTPLEIGVACRAGTGCGGCLPEVCRLLDDHLTGEAYFAASVACASCPLAIADEAELLSA